MKTLRLVIMALAFGMLGAALSSCEQDNEGVVEQGQDNNENPDDNQNSDNNEGEVFDESYYAENASISSSDEQFAVTDDGVVISFDASGGEVVVDVDCGTEWTAQNSAEDIFGCSIQSKTVTITAKQNLSGEELSGTITLMTAENHIEFTTINITQAANAYITLSPEELSLPNIGSTTSVAVESNYDWDYSYDSSNGWFTVEKNEKDSSLSITYLKNETDSNREGEVTITAGDGEKNVAEATLKITQSWQNLDALILEYTITDNNVTIRLPINNVTNVTIDWDDGTMEISSSNHPSHTFTTPGIYTITINGEAKRLNSYASEDFIAGTQYLTAVRQWGNIGLTSMNGAFYGCQNLTSLPAETGDAFVDVTTFKYAFRDCGIETIPSDLFTKCLKAEDFSYCFAYCYSLTTVPENIFVTCTAVTTFESCFYDCWSLTSTPSFRGFSKVTSFSQCFALCRSLTAISENLFMGCSAATNFYDCFSSCTSLTAVPKNIFAGCSAVTNFQWVFYYCTSLKTVPVSIFDDSFLVTNFSHAFESCSSLEGESPYTEMEMNGEKVKIHLYERGDYAVDMRWANPSGSGCFYKCTDLTDYSNIPSGWK